MYRLDSSRTSRTICFRYANNGRIHFVVKNITDAELCDDQAYDVEEDKKIFGEQLDIDYSYGIEEYNQ